MHKTRGQRDPALAFPLANTRDDADERRQANRAVAISAAGLAITGLVELLLAVLTGSVGLLGDAIHNLSDVSTSAVVFLGFRLSRRPPTDRYPYGLERAEDLAGVGIALVIWASAAFAGYESVRKLIDHGPTSFVGAGIAGAILGIIGNQAVARYKMTVGRRINSATLIADAHRLADGIDPGVIDTAEAAAGSVPGVVHAHARARWTGRTLRVEIEGWIDPDTTARAADDLGRLVADEISRQLPEAGALTWTTRAAPV